MVFTGFVLWFPTYFTRIMPGWIFEVSEVVHYYEAWLAFLAIVVWHFFYVLFGPEASPMNVTWMDGMTPVDHAMHKHGSLQPHQDIEYPKGEEKDPRRSTRRGREAARNSGYRIPPAPARAPSSMQRRTGASPYMPTGQM